MSINHHHMCSLQQSDLGTLNLCVQSVCSANWHLKGGSCVMASSMILCASSHDANAVGDKTMP